MPPKILSVSLSPTHTFSKTPAPEVHLLAAHGIEGDAHAGPLVRHRYRVRKDPTAPNLCQVHLLHAELFDELATQGIQITPGQMGENVTTRGLDLLSLPVGARLTLGASATVEITGLRDPCSLLNQLHPALMKACLIRTPGRPLIRKAGVMAIALTSGLIRPGDPITVELPPKPWRLMGPV